MVNLRAELKKMQKHREAYYPALLALLEIYEKGKDMEKPLQLRDVKEIPIILELIDTGYIESDIITVVRNFNTIESVWYNGRYPLTDKGDLYCAQQEEIMRKRTGRNLILRAGVAAVLLLAVYLLFRVIT